MISVTDKIALLKRLRIKREQICFPIINRGKLWYERLTNEQQGELRQWYQAWLDVTKTLEMPITPAWVNKTLNQEEEI